MGRVTAWLRGTGLSRRVQALVVVVTLLLGFAAVRAAPYPTKGIRWLTRHHTSSPDPSWDIPVDGSAFRRAAVFVDAGSTYYLWYPAAQTQYSHDLLGAGLLFLTPALPVREPSDADWVVSYRTRTLVPPGFPAGRRIRLANGIYLVHRRS
jgi:hypothetical protein